MSRPLIEVKNLVNRFGKHVVHDGVNLTVFENEILGIVGGSGTGKSAHLVWHLCVLGGATCHFVAILQYAT